MHTALSQIDQIQILLHEYDSLSAQLRQFDADQFEICNIAVIGGTVLFALWADNKLKRSSFLITSILFSALLLSSWLFIDSLIATVSGKMKGIEAQVNAEAGRNLLDWETQYGSGGTLGKYVITRSPHGFLGSWASGGSGATLPQPHPQAEKQQMLKH